MTQEATAPLVWSDARIESRIDAIAETVRHKNRIRDMVSSAQAEGLATDIRDDYEATLAALRAELAARDASIALLEAELAAYKEQTQERIAGAFTHGYMVANGWTGSDAGNEGRG